MAEAEGIFDNPRQHTGRGYQQRRQTPMCRYGRNCRRSDCRFEHPGPGPGGRGTTGGRGPCRYGNQCTRPDCWFDHPDGR
jgi:hypothetical protein